MTKENLYQIITKTGQTVGLFKGKTPLMAMDRMSRHYNFKNLDHMDKSTGFITGWELDDLTITIK
jgi:hypothetical protein